MIYAVNKRTKEHKQVTNTGPVIGCPEVMGTDGETWALVNADEGGWVKHDGSERPLPASARCDVQFSGGLVNDAKASQPVWSMVEAYRPILDAKPEPPAWDGEGLPPVGCECEGDHHEFGWLRGTVIYHDHEENIAVLKTQYGYLGFGIVRPIRSEEDRAIDAMREVFKSKVGTDESIYEALYAAIRDGKVPGVKLEDDS